MIRVEDLVKHLQTLPQTLPVMELWDEGGTFHNMI